MKTFRNKVVVITGAGSGMGRSYALQFAKLGAKVAINDYRKEDLDETEALLRKDGHTEVYAKDFDVSDEAAMNIFAGEVQATLGPAHVVVNNAGISGCGTSVLDADPGMYERVMNVNFLGVFFGTRAFLRQILGNGEGAIINVSSVLGFIGMPHTADYCASKFAVRGFTESLMVELMDTPVTVHLVHPGGIKTGIARGTTSGAEFSDRYLKTSPDDIVRYVIDRVTRNAPSIVYGYGSFRPWLVSRLLPLKLRTKLVYSEMKKLAKEMQQADTKSV